MKKLILILSICTLTSLSIATPVSAAKVVDWNTICNTKTSQTTNVKIFKANCNISKEDITKQINDMIAQAKKTNTATKPVATKPVATKPVATKPAATKPAATKPVATKPAATKPAATKPAATKPAATKPAATKPAATKPAATKPETTKPAATKPAPTKPEATKPVENTTTKPATTTTDTSANSNYKAFQQKVVELVNKERTAAGLSGLKEIAELDKVATAKSVDMAKNNYFSHTSPTYGSPFEMLTQFGVSYSLAGENIAYGQSTPEEVMKGWMNSEGHRANILRSNFTQIGVGIAKKANGQLVWTQTFTRP